MGQGERGRSGAVRAVGEVHAARQGLQKGSFPLNNFYAAYVEAGFNVTRPGPEDESDPAFKVS